MFKQNYKKYNELVTSLFKLTLEDNEVPQGICCINEFILISCYTTDKTNSRVILYDKNGKRIKTIILDTRAHVGGISYDKYHNVIFICDSNGYVSSFLYPEFINNNLIHKNSFLVSDKSIGGSYLLENGKLCCSYLTYYNKKLYVGSFNKNRHGIVKIFDVLRNDKLYLNYCGEFIVPNKIQGITFYNDGKITYVLLSKSYGRKNDSELLVFRYSSLQTNYLEPINSIKLPPMLEQITLNESNEVLLLFESNSQKYKYTSKFVTEDVMKLNIKDICN